jgi:hypothetical protein
MEEDHMEEDHMEEDNNLVEERSKAGVGGANNIFV